MIEAEERTVFDPQLLDLIAQGRNEEAVSLLRQDLINAVDGWGTLLHYAALYDNGVFARYMIQVGSNPNVLGSNGRTPLMVAVTEQQLNATMALVESGADMDVVCSVGDDALEMAINGDEWNPWIVKILLDKLREIEDEDNLTEKLLAAGCRTYHAACSGDIGMMSRLLSNGMDINDMDPYGATALHVAAQLNYVKLMNWLLNMGANPYLNQYFESQLLMFAVSHANPVMISTILERSGRGHRRINDWPITAAFALGPLISSAVREQLNHCIFLLLFHGAALPIVHGDTPTIFDYGLEDDNGDGIGIIAAHVALLDRIGRNAFNAVMYVNNAVNADLFVDVIGYYNYCRKLLDQVVHGDTLMFHLMVYSDHVIKTKVRNPEFVNDLERFITAKRIKVQCRYYYNTIVIRVSKARYRLDLEKEALEGIPKLYKKKNDLRRCSIILRLVIDYLSIQDLENLRSLL